MKTVASTVRGAVRRFNDRSVILLATIAISTVLVGCTVPDHMLVRKGVDPKNIDESVRFRTTYYFRVFDFCPPINQSYAKDQGGIREGFSQNRAAADAVFSPGDSRLLILIDSLYRFRMTGKANALMQRIHFESGTLRASEIDPFGSNVEFDEDNGRFFNVSARETKARAIESKEARKTREAIGRLEREVQDLATRRAGLKGTDSATLNQQATLDKLMARKHTTLDALYQQEHTQLLSSSPLEAVRTVSLLRADASATEFERLSHKMSELVGAVEPTHASVEALKAPLTLTDVAAPNDVKEIGDKTETLLTRLNEVVRARLAEFEPANVRLEQERRAKADEFSAAKKALAAAESSDAATQAMRRAELATAQAALDSAGERVEQGQSLLAAAQRERTEIHRMSATFSAKHASVAPPSNTGGNSGGQICADGTPSRRGFQIMGPEGWRTFDQDERLVMAMSTSAQPLIGVIKDLAARTNPTPVSAAERLLPFARERIRVLEAEKAVIRAQPPKPEDAADVVKAAIDQFNKDNPQRTGGLAQ